MRLSILYVGAKEGTSLHRARALADLGHRVFHVEAGPDPADFWRFQLFRVARRALRAPDVFGANRRMLKLVGQGGIDVVWVDKGIAIRPRTLVTIRKLLPRARLVSYSPDDMWNPINRSRAYVDGVPLYDVHITTKSYNVKELPRFGARRVLFVDNAYDPATHRPLELDPRDLERFRAEVGFVGYYEQERADWMLRLAEAGIPVTIRGLAWRRFAASHPNLRVEEVFLRDLDYTKAVNATRINLGFLRKINRDLQTTRSVEIPACGAFMLAERTEEHRHLFREGVEAEFFSSFDELLEKCRYYLAHEEERRRVAAAGLRRCIESGYSNQARLSRLLAAVLDGEGIDAPAGSEAR